MRERSKEDENDAKRKLNENGITRNRTVRMEKTRDENRRENRKENEGNNKIFAENPPNEKFKGIARQWKTL